MATTPPLRLDQAAAILGITTRRLQQIDHESDKPDRNPDGKYDCRKLGEYHERRTLKGIGVTDDGVIYDYDKERARLTKAQADKTELEVDVLRGKLIPSELVEAVWSGMTTAARSRLLAMPYRLAQSAMAAKSLTEVETAALDLITEALHELAGYDPEHYSPAIAGNNPPSDADRVAVETAPPPDSKPVGGPRAPSKPRGQRRTRPVAN